MSLWRLYSVNMDGGKHVPTSSPARNHILETARLPNGVISESKYLPVSAVINAVNGAYRWCAGQCLRKG